MPYTLEVFGVRGVRVLIGEFRISRGDIGPCILYSSRFHLESALSREQLTGFTDTQLGRAPKKAKWQAEIGLDKVQLKVN
jgi:hypothetical protein